MASDQNQVNVTTQVFSVDKELNSVSSPFNHADHDTQSPMMLEKLSDFEDNGLRNEILRRDDATESKLDEMMDKLLEILDETITIFGGDVKECDDSAGYILSDQHGVKEIGALGDAIIAKENARNNDQSIGCQTEAEGEIISLTVSKDQNGKCDVWSEVSGSLMIVLMLFSLYFLLSSMMI